jgi:DNA polymerase V
MLIRPTEDPPVLGLPLFASPASCGFPSPAQDYIETTLDLNQFCISRPSATYFVWAAGDSMINAGILDGDLLVVDRSITARHGNTVVACVDGEFTVKILQRFPHIALLPANPNYQPIVFQDEQSLEIFGVVMFVIHKQYQHFR